MSVELTSLKVSLWKGPEMVDSATLFVAVRVRWCSAAEPASVAPVRVRRPESFLERNGRLPGSLPRPSIFLYPHFEESALWKQSYFLSRRTPTTR